VFYRDVVTLLEPSDGCSPREKQHAKAIATWLTRVV